MYIRPMFVDHVYHMLHVRMSCLLKNLLTYLLIGSVPDNLSCAIIRQCHLSKSLPFWFPIRLFSGEGCYFTQEFVT